MTPDELAEIEEERRFLLASLSDLDREHEAGDLDEADYVALKDGYTARAAAILRAESAGTSVIPATPPPRWRRLAIGVIVTVAVAVGAGILVARGSGQRAGTETATGGVGDSIATLLSEARARLGSDHAGALSRYDKVLAIDPNNVEATTYKGWVLVQDGQVAQGEALIDQAIARQPDYPDARFFKGYVLVNVHRDPAGSLQQFDIVMKARPGSDVGKGAAQLADKAVGQLLDAARSTLTSDPVKAVQIYQKVLAFDPQNPTANSYMGFLLAQAGRADDGLALIAKAIAQQKDFADAYYLRALVLLNAKNDPQAAITALDAYLALKPGPDGVDQANALRKQARAALATGQGGTATSTTLKP